MNANVTPEPAADKAVRTLTGRVVSNKMEKTVVVAVESMRQHRLYGRNVGQTNRFSGRCA